MSLIGSTIRFSLGLLLSLEIIRNFNNNVSNFLLIIAIIYILLAIMFFIEKDMKGAKSYIRFLTAIFLSSIVIFNFLIEKEISSLATILAFFYFLMALWFFVKKSGLIHF